MLLLDVLAAAVAKVASASTVAQVAAGVGITVAGMTGAGVVHAVTSSPPVAARAPISPGHASEDVDPPVTSTVPAVPATPVPPTSVPTGTGAPEHVVVESRDDDGRQETTPAVPTEDAGPSSGRDHAEDDGPAAPSTADTPEVEDDHGGHDPGREDHSGHGGDG